MIHFFFTNKVRSLKKVKFEITYFLQKGELMEICGTLFYNDFFYKWQFVQAHTYLYGIEVPFKQAGWHAS